MTLLKQRGFNLIELMIVVAIIGILAAIAIPQYQGYQLRTQITEAVSLVSPIKTVLAELPSASSVRLAQAIGLGIVTDDGRLINPGKYISQIDFTDAIAGSATATITFASTATEGLANEMMLITVNAAASNGSGAIECRAADPNNEEATAFFPRACLP